MGELTDKMAGKAKQAAGKVTDDKKLQAEGKIQEAKGHVQGKVNDASDAIDKKAKEDEKDLKN